MRSIETIISDIEALSLDGDYWPLLYSLADEIENHPDGARTIQAVLQLFEHNPDGDFGTPGPLAHAVETYSRRGYENCLLESLTRKSTPFTLWLAHRIVNACDENESAFTPFAKMYEELLK
ncbi:MAG: hypothetical protein K8U57_13745 [Planctomycetes bacterium]|nr:hypothetical protein [Planctomycetota bacterium]